jgi:pSer/pThr/pTyr-binding forkhead associated (FHA) protein
VAASGPARGRDHRLGTRPLRVGTAPESEIRLPGDPYVSTSHAEVVVEGEEALVRDLGSTNGTYRNDERIHEAPLRDGDRLRFGLSEFVFKSVRL